MGPLGSEVLLRFLIEAVVLTTLGGVIGVAIATGVSFALSNVIAVPYACNPAIHALALACSACIGMVFGYFAARRAARMSPIEAL